MTRLRALVCFLLVLVASCAHAQAVTPFPDGGSGGSGGVTTGGGGAGGSGFPDAGPFVDAGACAPFAETYTPACLACLGASCCDVALTCFALPDCFGYASCQQNCPTGPESGGVGSVDGGIDAGNVCLAACVQNYPMSEPAFGAMTACLEASCAGICPY
jgi:hypothetical protein